MGKSSSIASQMKRMAETGEEWGKVKQLKYICSIDGEKCYKSKKAFELGLKLHKRKCEICRNSTTIIQRQRLNQSDISGSNLNKYEKEQTTMF
tara:strand:- start:159 stop:437 length:279 start_codon:yes stop_codon:yes gene_type:complete